jgi:hypothetical protein
MSAKSYMCGKKIIGCCTDILEEKDSTYVKIVHLARNLNYRQRISLAKYGKN